MSSEDRDDDREDAVRERDDPVRVALPSPSGVRSERAGG
jgi:hypothetical protein